MAEFAIYDIPVVGGVLGLSPLPGVGGYESDLTTVLQWDPDLVISATLCPEMEIFGADGLGSDLTDAGVAWIHRPIVDYGVASRSSTEWSTLSVHARKLLTSGGKVLVHCRGGCGRSGMIVLRLMVECGEDPQSALARLRKIRPCAVETKAQELWATRSVLG